MESESTQTELCEEHVEGKEWDEMWEQLWAQMWEQFIP